MRSVFLLFCVSGVAADASNHCNSNDADGHALLQAHSVVRKHKAMSEHVDAEVTAGISHHATSEHLDAEATAETTEEVAESEQSAAEVRPVTAVLHTQGMCPDNMMFEGEHQIHANELEECADFCFTFGPEAVGSVPTDESFTSGGCSFFAFDESSVLQHGVKNCWLYKACPCPGDAPPGVSPTPPCTFDPAFPTECPPQFGRDAYTTYEIFRQPGFQPPSAASETMVERCAHKVAEEEEFVCSQHRETVGTCRWLGCWASRGDTECVANRCVCSPGGCSNDGGVCVSQDDFTTDRCAGMSAPGSVDNSLSDDDRHYRDFVCAARASGR